MEQSNGFLSFLWKAKPEIKQPVVSDEVEKADAEGPQVFPKAMQPDQPPLPIESPAIQRVLKRFFESEYWPYIKDVLIREIIRYGVRHEQSVRSAVIDSQDPYGKRAAYLTGKLDGSLELRVIIERLRETTVLDSPSRNQTSEKRGGWSTIGSKS